MDNIRLWYVVNTATDAALMRYKGGIEWGKGKLGMGQKLKGRNFFRILDNYYKIW